MAQVTSARLCFLLLLFLISALFLIGLRHTPDTPPPQLSSNTQQRTEGKPLIEEEESRRSNEISQQTNNIETQRSTAEETQNERRERIEALKVKHHELQEHQHRHLERLLAHHQGSVSDPAAADPERPQGDAAVALRDRAIADAEQDTRQLEDAGGHLTSVAATTTQKRAPPNTTSNIRPGLGTQDSMRWLTDRSSHFSPSVDEKHKLVLCTIAKSACTAWRKFARRLAGQENWDTADERYTHNYGGKSSGLTYLNQLGEQAALNLMRRDDYFKLVIVRNPVTRILSAWKDKYGPGSVHHWGELSWPQFVARNVNSGELTGVCIHGT